MLLLYLSWQRDSSCSLIGQNNKHTPTKHNCSAIEWDIPAPCTHTRTYIYSQTTSTCWGNKNTKIFTFLKNFYSYSVVLSLPYAIFDEAFWHKKSTLSICCYSCLLIMLKSTVSLETMKSAKLFCTKQSIVILLPFKVIQNCITHYSNHVWPFANL